MNKLARLSLPFAALPLVATGAVSAIAQETQGDYRDFKLPTKPTPTAPVVGPTDETAPRPQRSTTAPEATATPAQQATPAPRPAPRIVLPPPPGAPAAKSGASAAKTEARKDTAPPAQPAGQPATPSAGQPAPTSSSRPFPSPPEVVPSLAGEGIAPAISTLASDAASGVEDSSSRWWPWAVAGAIAAALAGLLALRKRRGTEQAVEPEFVAPQPITPQPLAGNAEAAEPLPAPAFASAAALSVSLEAVRMSATLMNATLTYRLTVQNTGPQALHNIVVTGDMIGAHASVPQNEMLGETANALPVLHQGGALEPGAAMEWTGEIRLPLAAIVPIQRGAQRLFVPVARIAVSSATAGGHQVTSRGAFLVGQDSGNTARLQPFRLDLGPRNYSQLGQRALAPA